MSRLALAVLILSLPAAPALAGSSQEPDGLHCDFNVGPNDRLARHGDLVIASGQVVEDAIALSGNVIVRSGAHVTGNVIAMGGSVRIEKGAHVEKGAISLGGKVRVDPGATVDGSRISLADGLEVEGEDGGHLQLAFSDSQGSLGRRIVDDLLRELRRCKEQERGR